MLPQIAELFAPQKDAFEIFNGVLPFKVLYVTVTCSSNYFSLWMNPVHIVSI